ncbi:MAG TPA: hypothetical protein VGZ23_20035 [bacterium]|nr:hypothetical protein [bacterium]
MGSSTRHYAAVYQKLAHLARELSGARGAVLSRVEPGSLRVWTIAVAASPRTGRPRRASAVWTTPPRADANVYARRVYVKGHVVSAPLRAYAQGSPRGQAAAGYATVVPLRSHRGVAGALAFLTARRPRPVQARLYRGLARLASLVVELEEDAREFIADEERARRDAAALLHGTHAALIAIAHRLGESRHLLAADPAKVAGVVESARIELERIGERDIGETTRRLYPLIIRMSVTPALEALAERHRPAVDIALRVDPAVGEMDDPFQNRLPETLRLAVYRTAEALLAHAAKTASGRVEATVTRSAGPALVLTVTNAGEAIRPALGDILVRLHECRGTLAISKRRDGRTTVSASFPLPTPTATAGPATQRNPASPLRPSVPPNRRRRPRGGTAAPAYSQDAGGSRPARDAPSGG